MFHTLLLYLPSTTKKYLLIRVILIRKLSVLKRHVTFMNKIISHNLTHSHWLHL